MNSMNKNSVERIGSSEASQNTSSIEIKDEDGYSNLCCSSVVSKITPNIKIENQDEIHGSCCVKLNPAILLRNLIVPEAMWEVLPKGVRYGMSEYLLYQPDFPIKASIFVKSPYQYGLPYEELWIQTKDRVKLHAYLIKEKMPSSPNFPTILFFHGNAGNIGDRLENVKMIFQEVKCQVLLIEYRGYGYSQGNPSEKGLYLDAQAAFKYIDDRKDLDSKKIIVFGHSLGGAVAIDLASRSDFRDRVAGLIVENTFSSIPELVKHLFPIKAVRWVPRFCYKNRYESSNKISSVLCPTLFVCGTDDELIPPFMMTELYTKCSSHLKRFNLLQGGHNNTWRCKDYTARVSEFIAEDILATGNSTYSSC